MKDILLDNKGELVIDVQRDSNGLIMQGIVVGESDYQNMKFNIQANKGEFKEYPELGGEIMKSQNGFLERREMQKIKLSLEMDGYDINDTEILKQ